jgi:hypothetical protein
MEEAFGMVESENGQSTHGSRHVPRITPHASIVGMTEAKGLLSRALPI